MLLPLVICPSFDNKVVSIHDSNVVEFVFPDFGCKVRQANKDSPYIGLNKWGIILVVAANTYNCEQTIKVNKKKEITDKLGKYTRKNETDRQTDRRTDRKRERQTKTEDWKEWRMTFLFSFSSQTQLYLSHIFFAHRLSDLLAKNELWSQLFELLNAQIIYDAI